LEQCLNSVIADCKDFKTEIFVIDNDSRDGTPEMVMAEYPDVTMISLPKNRGFAAANNLGLRQAKGKYLFLLNPDTEVQPGFFRATLDYLDQHNEVGILGPRILNPDYSLQPSVRRDPKFWSQLLILLKIRNLWPNNRIFKHYFAKDFDYNQEQDAEQILGAAMFITRETFEKIGLLDEKFFVWFEEVDYCRRARKRGVVIRYLPSAHLIHHGGSSFAKQQNFKKQIFFDASLFYYFCKHRPVWETLFILLIIPLNLVVTFLYAWWLKHYKAN
jgi:hypothetical protein